MEDMESKAKRFERKTDLIKALGHNIEVIFRNIKSLKAENEHFERQEQAVQRQTQVLIEALRNGVNEALTQTYTDFSGLTERVIFLEGMRQRADSAYTATMSNRENWIWNWRA